MTLREATAYQLASLESAPPSRNSFECSGKQTLVDTGEKGFPKFSTLEKVSIASRYSSGLIDEEENLTCKWCYGVLVNARSDMMAFGVILNT